MNVQTDPAWPRRLGATELIWHRANTRPELGAFLASDVGWVEADARSGPDGVVRVHHEPLDGSERGVLLLEDWLEVVRSAGRRAKIDLKEGGMVPERALEAVRRVGFDDEGLWFNAAVEIPGERGFLRILGAHPGSRVSCPLDTLAPYLQVTGDAAFRILDLLRSWGVNWLCLGACVPGVRDLVPSLHERGWPVNIWDVEDDDDLRVARSMEPQAITADLGAIDPTAWDTASSRPSEAALSPPPPRM